MTQTVKDSVNEYLVKISAGSIVVDTKDLKIDDEVVLAVKGSVVKTEDKSNQNGTVNRVFIVKGYLANVIYKQKSITKPDVSSKTWRQKMKKKNLISKKKQD